MWLQQLDTDLVRSSRQGHVSPDWKIYTRAVSEDPPPLTALANPVFIGPRPGQRALILFTAVIRMLLFTRVAENLPREIRIRNKLLLKVCKFFILSPVNFSVVRLKLFCCG